MEDLIIELWEQYKCMFNISSMIYHNRTENEKCLADIAFALGATS